MASLSQILGGGMSKGEKKGARLRAQRAAANRQRAAAAAEAQRRADAAAKARADAARAQAQAQARAQAEAERRAAEEAERARIAAAKELSDKRVAEFNSALDSAKQQGSKEIQLLRASGLKSEDERVRELAGGITENKATALDAPDKSVSAQKASVKRKIQSRSRGSGRSTTIAALGGNTFSLG